MTQTWMVTKDTKQKVDHYVTSVMDSWLTYQEVEQSFEPRLVTFPR